MSATLAAHLAAQVRDGYDEMVDIRRLVHSRPELSFEETATTALVTARLAALGLTLRPSPTPTGAVAVLEGGRPGRTVLLRADIDGLPLQEQSGLRFASEVDGRMHACGHDAHVAAMLGVAGALAAHAEDLPGRYLFVFQPAEERVSGAQAMVDGGLLDGVDAAAALGMHVVSIAPTGTVMARRGISMAGGWALQIVVTGSGGHSALEPRQGNVVLAASSIATRLASVVEDMSSEGTSCVCSPGMIVAGTAPNVVPARAELSATLRCFDQSQRDVAMRRLSELVTEVGEELDVAVSVETSYGTGPVRNDPHVTDVVLDELRRGLPDVEVVEMASPVPASDDVSVLLERVPGCYLLVGAALADGSSGTHHSPRFAIDERSLEIGATVLSRAAVRLGAPSGAG
ncbi:MAG: M20 metallopeptidase family protein [Acidimicrobiales bacterium]